MEPDSEETRRIFEPDFRWDDLERACTMKGGAIADVAGVY
jgi:hypothetical protein